MPSQRLQARAQRARAILVLESYALGTVPKECNRHDTGNGVGHERLLRLADLVPALAGLRAARRPISFACSNTQRRMTPAMPQRSSIGVIKYDPLLMNKFDMVPQTMLPSTSRSNPSQTRGSRHSLRAITDSRRLSVLRPARIGLVPSRVAHMRTRTAGCAAATARRGGACSEITRVQRSSPLGR